METASLSDIRNELKSLSPAELQAIVLRLAKFKKENKELVSYLLFNAADETFFLQDCRNEIDVLFRSVNRSSHLFVKKTLRKTLRITNQYIKFSTSPKVEIELLVYFCKKMKESGFNKRSHPVIVNIYLRQVERIKKTLKTLHEDLQFDYADDIEQLNL